MVYHFGDDYKKNLRFVNRLTRTINVLLLIENLLTIFGVYI